MNQTTQKKDVKKGGLRSRGILRENLPDKPLLTIITVVYNGQMFLEKTVQSILNQTYDNIEYIIIDGGSTDGTINIIKKYEAHIDYWISEPDKGIYDAMNKGITAASDAYLWFINAGDLIYDNHTVTKILKADPSDIYYGKTALINNQQQVVNTLSAPKLLTWEKMYQGMLVSHQSIIIHKKIADFYDLRYRYVSDHDWIINSLKKTTSIRYVDIIFSRYLLDGFSQANFAGCWSDRLQIIKKHYQKRYLYVNYSLYIKERAKRYIKKIVKKK